MNKLEEPKLLEAIDKATYDVIRGLKRGEEIELNDKYTLYHYTEDDVIVICESDEWEELLQIMYDPNTKEVFFESLI